MDEQLYFVSPFGLENVRSQVRYTEGWGWGWGVFAWDGHRWATVDSGLAKSDRRAIRAVAECLERLAQYEELEGPEPEAF